MLYNKSLTVIENIKLVKSLLRKHSSYRAPPFPPNLFTSTEGERKVEAKACICVCVCMTRAI